MHRLLIIGGLATLLLSSTVPAPPAPVIASPIVAAPDQSALLALQEQNRLLRSQLEELQSRAVPPDRSAEVASLTETLAKRDQQLLDVTFLLQQERDARKQLDNNGPPQPAAVVQTFAAGDCGSGSQGGRRGPLRRIFGRR